VSTATV